MTTTGEMLRAWQRANETSWVDFGETCEACKSTHTTGDVVFSFPPLERADDGPAIERRGTAYRCVTCSWKFLQAGVRFDGAGVYVETRHTRLALEDLPSEVREKLQDAFARLDALHQHLAQAAAGKSGEES